MEHNKLADPLGPFGPLGPIDPEGKPGDPVPEVDPEDIKTVWNLYDDTEARNPGVVIGIRVIQAHILERAIADNRVPADRGKQPGSDAMSVSYRAGVLRLLIHFQWLDA